MYGTFFKTSKYSSSYGLCALTFKHYDLDRQIKSYCVLGTADYVLKRHLMVLTVTLCLLRDKKKLRVLSPQANYTDRAAAAGRRS